MREYDEIARDEFAEVDRLRAERGLSGPYERVAFWPGGDRGTAERIAAEGVTTMVVFAWPQYSDLTVDAKIAKAEEFATSIFGDDR